MPHLLNLFRYCPHCGSAHFCDNDERSRRCEECGFTYYLNASAATAAFIVREGEEGKELLVCRRAGEPAKGTLDLPGGFVDPGESITNGMLREIREEVGVEAHITRFLFSIPNWYEYSGFRVPTSDAFFLVEIPRDTTLSPHDDCDEVRWIPISKINAADFGLASIRQAVELFLSEVL